MTESEWLASGDMADLWTYLRDTDHVRDQRKVRLFACACCRRAWHLLTDTRSRMAVERAEEYADGRITEDEISTHSAMAWEAVSAARTRGCREAAQAVGDASGPGEPTACTVSFAVSDALVYAAPGRRPPGSHLRTSPDWLAEQAIHATLARDVFGNPFRPVKFRPRWRTAVALEIARGIYANRTFDRMPILADTLEDAECNIPDMLSHCRGDGPHVRGCWVVDLILGKG